MNATKRTMVWLLMTSMVVAGPTIAASPGLRLVDPDVADKLFGSKSPSSEMTNKDISGIENLRGWDAMSPRQRQLAREQVYDVMKSDPVRESAAKRKKPSPRQPVQEVMVAGKGKEVSVGQTKKGEETTQGSIPQGVKKGEKPGAANGEHQQLAQLRETNTELEKAVQQLNHNNNFLKDALDAAETSIAGRVRELAEAREHARVNWHSFVEKYKALIRAESELGDVRKQLAYTEAALVIADKKFAARETEIKAQKDAEAKHITSYFRAAEDRVRNFFAGAPHALDVWSRDRYASMTRGQYALQLILVLTVLVVAAFTVIRVRRFRAHMQKTERRMEIAESDTALSNVALDHFTDLLEASERRREDFERQIARYEERVQRFVVNGVEKYPVILRNETGGDGKEITVYLTECGAQVRGSRQLFVHYTKSCGACRVESGATA